MENQSGPRAVFKRYRYLGQRWRFLKDEFQNETFPGFKRVRIDAIKLETSFTNHDSTPFIQEVGAVESNEAVVGPGSDEGTTDDVRAAEEFNAGDEMSDQDKLLVQLRNAHLFHRSGMYPAEHPVEEESTVGSPRASYVSSTRTSEATRNCKRSTVHHPDFFLAPICPALNLRRRRKQTVPSRREIFEKNANYGKQTVPCGNSKTGAALQNSEIGQSFKAYAVEKGFRVPICLADTNYPLCVRASSPPVNKMDNILSMTVVPSEPQGSSLFPSRPRSVNRLLVVPADLSIG